MWKGFANKMFHLTFCSEAISARGADLFHLPVYKVEWALNAKFKNQQQTKNYAS